MKLGKPLIAAALLPALALAGCGGGGEETTAASVPTVEESPALSKQELIQQGDAICAEVNAAVGTVDASEAETADQVTQAADLYSGMVERIKALGPPEEEDAGYTEFTEAADALAQAESDAQLASERGDETALAEAESKVEASLESFEEAAGSYGFEQCSESPSAPSVVTPAGGGGGEEAEAEEVEVPAEVEEEVVPEEAPPEEAPAEEAGGGGTAGGGTGAGGGEEAGGGGSGGIGPG
jgi:hypothetical protein